MDKAFESQGYVILKKLISADVIQSFKTSIQKQIEFCAKDIGCSQEAYLSAVSRWLDPSPVTSEINPEWINQVASRLSDFAGEEVYLNKMNIICKNAYCTGAVPLHQDISYSPDNPYQFSTWIALDPVTVDNGSLIVVPGSHLEGIFPAIDFWSPQYKAPEKKTIPLPVEKGDGICFDSRLWHGSPPSQVSASRFAWVLRWKTKNWKLKEKIPPPQPLPNGMWNCWETVIKHLSKEMKNPSNDLAELIELYPSTPSLERLKILHLASAKHNGGDAMGSIYKEFISSI